ncbi:phosphatidylinositol 4-phosphate 5-kinase MSS4-like protein [Perilla frutescens var. frutescens]|nr:phosphatidylinositol 4-phosphate 5-kinase MSS4-like protein [Perilla frutescens var. frutescens]
MKNTIRCCISCILPCGALDVIRIVHTNGRVEEINGAITAAEIMKLHPKHVLKKPSSPSADGMCPKIIVVPPDAELQRGKIYFLMPLPPPAEKTRPKLSTKRKKKEAANNNSNSKTGGNNSVADLLISDRYLSEILSTEKVSSQRDRRRGRGRVWRPHLDSITEAASDA